MLDDDSVVVTPPWHRILTLEALLGLLACSPGFARAFFESSPAMFARAVEGLGRIVQGEPGGVGGAEAPSRGLELLGDAEPPTGFTAQLAAVVALEAVVALVDVLAEVQSDTGAAVRVGGLRRHGSLGGNLSSSTGGSNLGSSSSSSSRCVARAGGGQGGEGG
jgi:hypothetical protein